MELFVASRFGNKKYTIKFLLIILLAFFMGRQGYATDYYSKTAGGAVQTVGNWGTNMDGTGTAPTVFTNTADNFIIRSAMANSGVAWTVSNVQIVAGGTLTITAVAVTVTNITIDGGTLNLSSSDLTVSGGTFALTNTAGSTLTAPITRTVTFNGTCAINITSSTAPTFGRILINGNTSTSSNFNLSGTALTFVINSGFAFTQGGGTINFTGTTSVFTNTGTMNGTNGIINFNGTTTTTFTNNGTVTSTGGTINLNSPTSNFINNSTFTPSGTQNINFNSTTGSIAGATPTFKNLTISSGTLTQTSTTINVNGSFTNNATFTAGTGTKAVVFGTGGIISGTSATAFNRLTILATNTSDVIYFSPTAPNTSISVAGILTITKGRFNVGSANTINMGASSSIVGSATLNDGDFDSGSGGGTIKISKNGLAGGSTYAASSSYPITFYNLTTTGGDGNIQLNIASGTIINGTFTGVYTVTPSVALFNTQPIWGASSKLSINTNGNAYTPNTEWSAASGTIGVTPGYPNDVTIMNLAAGTTLTGSLGMNGTLSVGDGTTAGSINLGTLTSFTCGGIIIDQGSTLSHGTESFTVTGNWLQKGTPTGVFTASGTTPVIFSGDGTASSPQKTISSAGASTTITSINSFTLNNRANIKLASPVTLPATGSFNLTSGILETSTANILSITNTAINALNGTGSSANYINGPLNWYLLSSGTNVYNFPVGEGATYLPLSFSSKNTIVGNVATVQAFASSCGGSGLILSATEYWSLATSAGLGTTGSFISSISRPATITPLNLLARSTTKTGTYTSITATLSANGFTNSADIGTASPGFFAFASLIPQVTLDQTNIAQTSPGYIPQGSPDNILSRFRVHVTGANATLNSISFPIGGSFVANDLTNLKLYTNTTATFPVAGTPVTLSALSFAGGSTTVTFSSLNQSCPIAGTGDTYFWITADVEIAAHLTKTVIVPVNPALTFSGTTNTGSTSIAVGGTQEISAPVPVITVNQTGIAQTTASSITQGSVNNIVSNFAVNVTVSNATLNTVSFTGTGNFVSGDISNFKLYSNTVPDLTGSPVLLNTVAATSFSGISTVTFSGLTQACNIGTIYLFITADVSPGATTTKTIIVPATPAVTFALGGVTNTIAAGGPKSITAGTPVITLDHSGITQMAPGNIVQGSADNILSNFRVNVTTANATLNSISFTAAGTFSSAHITNIKLYTNTSATFPAGATLLSTVAGNGTGGTVTFSSLSQTCSAAGTGNRYFWITADVGTGTTAIGKTIIVPGLPGTPPACTFTAGGVTNNIAVGGTQTIIAATPVITLNHTGITQTTAGNIITPSSSNILSNFRANVTTADATLNSISFTLGGSVAASDVTNIKLYTNTSATFPAGATLISTVTGVGAGGTVTFSSLTQACAVGNTYFWITADIASSVTVGKTISVPAVPTVTFALGTPVNNITAGGTKTITVFTTYYNTTVATDASLPASWTTDPTGVALTPNPANFTSGDKFIVRSGSSITINNNWALSGGANTELIINGQLTQNGSKTFSIAGTFTNNNSFNNGNGTITFGTNGSIGGTSATTFNNVVINTTIASDIVTLTNSTMSLQNGATLTITKGVFNVGTGNEIIMGTGGGMTLTTTANGNFATTGTNGSDGGTMTFKGTSGSVFTVNGTAKFFNLRNNSDGNCDINFVTVGVVINGTLSISGGQAEDMDIIGNSPIWGPASTLYRNNGNHQYIPGLEWVAMSSGTINVTAGYPNNVTMTNMGSSFGPSGGEYVGFLPGGNWSINGTLSIGDGTTSGYASLSTMSSFSCGGIIINNSSKLVGTDLTNFVVKGNWTRQGSSIGNFINNTNTGVVTFAGGTSYSAPQIISVSSGIEDQFKNVAISGTNTYVKLNSPVTLPITATLTLTNGIVETNSVNILNITNTVNTGITGGSSTAYINGPVNWTMAQSSTTAYTFPVGKYSSSATPVSNFLPFKITPDNSSNVGNIATVEAFNTYSGGSGDGTTSKCISNTEYWSMKCTASLQSTVPTRVSVARTIALGGYSKIAESIGVASSGTYYSIGGTPGTLLGATGGFLTSNDITSTSATNTYYFALGTDVLPSISNPITAPAVCAGAAATVSLTSLIPNTIYTVNYTINGVAQTQVQFTTDGTGNGSFNTPALTYAAADGKTLSITSLSFGACIQTTFSGGYNNVVLSVGAYVTWLATTDNNWDLASNWCGGIPTSSSNVLIPYYGGSNVMPVVKSGVSSLCKDITINASSTVTINSGGSLAVAGAYSSNGSLTNDGEIIFNGSTGAQSFPGVTGTISTMNNITVNNALGITFNKAISISGALTPTAGIINVSNAVITLLSSATATARVGVVGSTGGFAYTGTGIFSVERYMDKTTVYSSRRWHLLTVPFKNDGNAQTINTAWQEGALTGSLAAPTNPNPGYGTLITKNTSNNIASDGFDQGSTSNPSIYYLNPGTSTFGVPADTKNTKLTDHDGYMLFVRGDRTIHISDAYVPATATNLRAKGYLNTGDISKDLAAGRNFVGNPYASAIKMDSVTIDGVRFKYSGKSYYYWDPKMTPSGTLVGKFITVSDAGAPGFFIVTGNSSNITDGTIESGMAINVNSAGTSTSDMIFHEADKKTISSNKGLASRPMGDRPPSFPGFYTLATNFYTSEADATYSLADGIVNAFHTSYNNDADEKDAAKLSSFNQKDELSLGRDNKNLAIEKRLPVEVNDTAFLQIKNLVNKSYQFRFTANNFDPAINAILEDTYTNTKTFINTADDETTSYDFSVDNDIAASINVNRFRIVFRSIASGSLPVKFTNVNALPQTATAINVAWNVANETNIKEYQVERSLDGIHFSTAVTIPSITNNIKYNWIDDHIINGINYYRIKSIGIDGANEYSQIVKVSAAKSAGEIIIYPNPVKNNTINLQMTNMPKGIYITRLLNEVGQLISTGKIDHSVENNNEVLIVNEKMAKGIYDLLIQGPGNYKKLLIIKK